LILFVGPMSESAEMKRAMSAVRGHLTGLNVTIRCEFLSRWPAELADQVSAVGSLAEKRNARAVFWLVGTLRVRLYALVADKGQAKVFARQVGGDSRSGRLETLGLIVRASVQAILAGNPAGRRVREDRLIAPRPPDSRAAKHPAGQDDEPESTSNEKSTSEQRARPADHWVEVQAGYVMDVFAARPAVTHGLWLGAEVKVHRYLSLYGSYRVYPEINQADSLAAMKLSRHPAAVGVMLRWPMGRVRVSGLVAGGVDLLRYRVDERPTAPAGTEVDQGGRDAVFFLDFLALASIRLIWRLRGFVGLGIQVPLNARRYYSRQETDHDLVAPLAVQPLVIGGLSVAAW
jgi:hypothetical protein